MEQEKEKKSLQFASLEELVTATKSTSTYKYSRDDIETYLGSPFRYHAKLREISSYFSITNGVYANILKSFANLPTLDNIVIPSTKTLQKSQDKSYPIYLTKINNYIETINVKVATRDILSSVAKYGGYVGYERNLGNEYFIQSLPLDYCRIKYKVGHEYQIEFNFKYFDKFWNKEDVDLAWLVYPQEFKKLYNRYKSDKKSKNPEWQMIDIKKTYCVLANNDEPYFIPMFSTMFEAILNNEEYKDIVKLGDKLDVSKLVLQKVPLDKEGNIAMAEPLVGAFHNALTKAVPEGVSTLTTPMEIDSVPFTSQTQTKEDLLSKAERGVFVDSGWSSALYAENGGISSINMNIEIVTANIFAILEKIEDMFSRKFKNIVNTKNYDFRLKFYRTTNVNINENFDRQMKLVAIGGCITPVLGLTGMDSESYLTLLQIENELGIKDYLIPPQNMNQMSGKDNASKNQDGGRPSVDENKTTNDSTATSKERDSNNPTNRA